MSQPASYYGPEKYKEILIQNGITEEVECVEFKQVKTDGDGYASACEIVSVKFQDDQRLPLSLFVKKQVENQDFAQQLNECCMYEREHKFFNVLIPKVVELAEKSLGYDGFLEDAIPKCYYADGYLVALDNLKAKGYSMLDRRISHGLHEAKLCVDGIAKFHAATYALVQSMGLEAFMAANPFVHDRNTYSETGINCTAPWFQMPVDGAIKILKAKPTPGSEKALAHFMQYATECFQKLVVPVYDLANPSCAVVVNHGDFWNSNVMFKVNSETNKAEECVVIDWQTIHLGSPVLDLQFYLFMVVSKEVRRCELVNILNYYYERFSHYSRQLGQEPLFSCEDLVKEFRRKCSPGLIVEMYQLFVQEALSQVGNIANEDGDVLDNLQATMSRGLDRLMDAKGEEFSKSIVDSYELFLKIKAGL